MSTAQQRADWSLRPRGTVSAAAQGALSLAALGAAGHDVLHLHPGWAAAAATLGVIGTALTGGQHPPRALGYRLGCWLAAGGWLTWSWAATPWTQAALATLGLGTLAAGLLASWANTTPAPATPAHPAAGALVLRRHAKVADEWAARIRRCCNNLQVTIEDVEEWATKTGYTLTILLPLGGVTADRLRNAAEGLATDARLLKGCGIEVVDGDLRGTVLMHVATVNRLAADIDHPGDHSPRSVLNGITLGEYRNGDPMRLQVRQPRTIVVGTTGSAKTGTLHTITCELGLCTDNLVWHMDLNGGGVSQPWLRAWLDGQVERPAIDWAAGCPEEALLMAHAEVAIAKARKTAYSTRRMEADTDLLPVGEDVPQITTILDEGFEVLAPTVRDPLQAAIRGHLEETARIGRAEACQVLISALRSISTTISTDLLSLMHNRIIMAGCQQKEITFLYNQARGVGVADLAGPGSGFARLFGSHEIRPWKAWRMKPKRDIRPASLAISRLRPDLDTPSATAAGQAYATRLERMRWLFSTAEQRTRLTPPEPIELPMTDTRGQPIIWDPAVTHPPAGDTSGREVAPAPAPAAPAAPRGTGRLALLHGGATAGWATPEQVTARTRPAAPPGTHPYPSGPRPRLVAEQIHELPAAEAPVPELLVQALALPWDSGRLHSEALAKALRMSEHELAALLGLLGVTTLPNAFERGGQRRRGYKRGDLEDAAEAIRSGDLPVPPEVADWPAA